MKMNRFVIMFVAVMMIFPAVGFAEVIQGVINELNTASNTLGITRINPDCFDRKNVSWRFI